MSQLTVYIDDPTKVSSIKKAISMLRGVTDVKRTPAKSTLKSSYDKSHDDLEHGRVNVYDNPEELFDKLGL